MEDKSDSYYAIECQPLALRAQGSATLHMLEGELLVGREVECDIRLAFPQVSRYHAKIVVSLEGVTLEDLNSSNGTSVNGKRISSPVRIFRGDLVSFDDVAFRVTLSESQSSSKPKGLPQKGGKIGHMPAGKRRHSLPEAKQEAKKRPDSAAQLDERSANRKAKEVSAHQKSNVQEISNKEEFLRFAGSALKAQKPLSPRESNPFGLKRHQDRPMSSDQRVAAVSDKKQDTRNPSENQAPAKQNDDGLTRFLGLRTLGKYASTYGRVSDTVDSGDGPRLVVLTAPIRGKAFELRAAESVKSWRIGRDDSTDICLRDEAVSREHARITKMNTTYRIQVSDSATDVLVNGKIQNECELSHGDRIQLGKTSLVFRTHKLEDKKGYVRQSRHWFSRFFRLFRRS